MNLSHPFIIATLYSLPAVALSATGTLFIVHLPKFHSETVDISLGTISLALLISRAFDAFTDPVIGSLSDRIRIPFFRRPLWVLLGGTVTAFLFYWVCATSFIGYFGSTPFSYIALTVLFFLSFTAILIPYESWGLEITRNRRTRDIIVMFREGATLCGAVVAGALPL
ncbi:MFS transporter, partial [bacterium]|nr:MFS transporter [bacterium]